MEGEMCTSMCQIRPPKKVKKNTVNYFVTRKPSLRFPTVFDQPLNSNSNSNINSNTRPRLLRNRLRPEPPGTTARRPSARPPGNGHRVLADSMRGSHAPTLTLPPFRTQPPTPSLHLFTVDSHTHALRAQGNERAGDGGASGGEPRSARQQRRCSRGTGSRFAPEQTGLAPPWQPR